MPRNPTRPVVFSGPLSQKEEKQYSSSLSGLDVHKKPYFSCSLFCFLVTPIIIIKKPKIVINILILLP